MGLTQFGRYAPDISDYEATATRNVLNVSPQADGYGPFPAWSSYTSALPAACRGAFYALNTSGEITVFAGTVDRLYQLSNTNQTWIPISATATCTISHASPAVVTLTNTFAAGDPVQFFTTGALPTGLAVQTVYYVSATGLSGSSFQVSATSGGASINTTSAGSGTQSVTVPYSSLSSGANWTFAQFNNDVIACQANVNPQVVDITTTNAFAALGGSPPAAANVNVVGQFLILSGLTDYPFRIQWSGLDSITTWTAGTNSSDYQDFADGGPVQGVVGDEQSAIVLQTQAIRVMTYAPGSPLIFQIQRIARDMGALCPGSIVRAGSNILFYSTKGFQSIAPGGLPTPIGRERVDRTFAANLDTTNTQLFTGVADPKSTKVYWFYKSNSGTPGQYDSGLGYDQTLDRWFPVQVSGQYPVALAQAGITLDGLDTYFPDLDTIPISLDAFPASYSPEIAQFNTSNQMSFFRGFPLQATLETPEQGTDGTRIFIRGFRPITDATTIYGSASFRDTQQIAPVYTSEVVQSQRTGRCDFRKSTRYSRMHVRIPANTIWTFAAGVEIDTVSEGQI